MTAHSEPADSRPSDPDPGRTSPADESGELWSKSAMIVPLVVFFALGMLIDTSPVEEGQTIQPTAYLTLTTMRVLLMSVALAVFGREIVRQFPLAVDYRGWLFGVVGAGLWIGVCSLELERTLLDRLGLAADWLPARESVDPFETYAGTQQRVFLAVRFTLLAVCVPIAEELFLRGFIMRAVEVESWTRLRVEQIGRTGLIVGTVYGAATHPGELIAAVLWFSMITWLMVTSKRFWNCVVAHAVTNLILGIYVCWYGQWHLW